MNNALFKALFNSLSLAGRRLTIVLFHRVLSGPDPLLPDAPDRRRFAQILRWLGGTFTVMTLRDAVTALEAGGLPRRALVITFDDGYADNATEALPELQAAGLPATFFVTTRFMNGGLMWNDRVIEAVRAWQRQAIDLTALGLPCFTMDTRRIRVIREIQQAILYRHFNDRENIATELFSSSGSTVTRLMMDSRQIRLLHDSGMEIGAHTHSHPILVRLGSEEARSEIATNKALLEQIIGGPVTSFAYPNGRVGEDYTVEHMNMAAELGFNCAVTTMPGTVANLEGRFEIPRFSPWDQTRPRYLARLVRNYFAAPRHAEDA
jgi:peptidoglycan/xylan/chitin deacetylase (PgdA/CDA1 family)